MGTQCWSISHIHAENSVLMEGGKLSAYNSRAEVTEMTVRDK